MAKLYDKFAGNTINNLQARTQYLCGVFHALNNTQLTIISHSSIFSKK